MDKNGNICTSECKQAARWVQHFQEVLNLPEPEQPANITTADDILEINTDPPDSAEVKAAIQTLKSGNACYTDAEGRHFNINMSADGPLPKHLEQ